MGCYTKGRFGYLICHIPLGDHRLKYVHLASTRRTSLRGAGWDDTTLIESMRDLRKSVLT